MFTLFPTCHVAGGATALKCGGDAFDVPRGGACCKPTLDLVSDPQEGKVLDQLHIYSILSRALVIVRGCGHD